VGNVIRYQLLVMHITYCAVDDQRGFCTAWWMWCECVACGCDVMCSWWGALGLLFVKHGGLIPGIKVARV
jgi:hypothetical protein